MVRLLLGSRSLRWKLLNRLSDGGVLANVARNRDPVREAIKRFGDSVGPDADAPAVTLHAGVSLENLGVISTAGLTCVGSAAAAPASVIGEREHVDMETQIEESPHCADEGIR